MKRSTKRKTREEFIANAVKIHGDFYDYSLVEYINAKTNVKIICPIHKEFEQTPNVHLKKAGCLACGTARKTFTLEDFIKSARQQHGDKYNYDKVVYINSKKNVIITCPIHDDFEQTPQVHMYGSGCPECAATEKSYGVEVFIEKANAVHNNYFDYSKVKYKNTYTKVIIICPVHKEFEQLPKQHLRGSACPSCNNNIAENEWLDFVGISKESRQYKIVFPDGRYARVDGIDLKTSTIYEYYGDIFHGNPNTLNPLDRHPMNDRTYQELYETTLERESRIKALGYKIITIWESDWKKQTLFKD